MSYAPPATKRFELTTLTAQSAECQDIHRHAELVGFIKSDVLEFGRFNLASGKVSDFYLDVKKASFHPRGATLIAEALWREIRDLAIDSVGGMDMGATPIVATLAMKSLEMGSPIPSFVVRKKIKPHGTKRKIEGLFKPGDRVVIVDDVVTTGGSILQAINAVDSANGVIKLAVSVVDREEGAREALEACGIEYLALVTATALGIS